MSNLGYLNPNVNGNQSRSVHLQLGGQFGSEAYTRLLRADADDYVLYKANDEPIDGLFNSFILSPNLMQSGRSLNPLYTGFTTPPKRSDWKEWLDELFAPGANLIALHEAVRGAQHLCKQADIWITLPYPEPSQRDFGEVRDSGLFYSKEPDAKARASWWAPKDGEPVSEGSNGHASSWWVPMEGNLDFSNESDRLTAIDWWITRFMRRWREAGLEPFLRLRGFRWPRETVLNEQDLIAGVAAKIHSLDLQFMWLANYGAAQATDWATLGFDVSVLHPNYYGNTSYGWDWIDNASLFARYYGCGMQIVYGKGLLYDQNHIYDYLNRGLPEFNGYMKESFLVMHFDGINIREIYDTDRKLYIQLYCFFKGLYTKENYEGIGY
jgi:hypothetical protein